MEVLRFIFMPHTVKSFLDVKCYGTSLPEALESRGPHVSYICEITTRSRRAETILVVREKMVWFKVGD